MVDVHVLARPVSTVSVGESGSTGRRPSVIRTPDQRLRVFVSSTLRELAAERQAATEAINTLHLTPVLFELGARPHPPQELYRAYLEQSHIFIGIYWQSYGWVAPHMEISGLEDEYRLSGERPKLIYLKSPAPERQPQLATLLEQIRNDDTVSYKSFSTPEELRELIENDLALLLTEHFEMALSEPGNFPLLGSPNALLNVLPVPPTPLIDRQEEVAAVKALLLDDEVHLVTLLGLGGIGKSRVALAVAAELQDAFLDGVYFVALAASRDPALVASTIARVLGIYEKADIPSSQALITYLRDKQVLLVLDNFEQVIAAAPVLGEVLASCRQLKVLVTSREALRLYSEHAYQIPPLGLPILEEPTPEGADRSERISHSPAVQLFVQRARAINPHFRLNHKNAIAVAEICIRLDGLPLAIELAAARTRFLTPQAILIRLGRRLELLTSSARDMPGRHQTLRATIEWSYQLLSPEEQRLFRQLAVFRMGSTLEATSVVVTQEESRTAAKEADEGEWTRRAMYLSDPRPSTNSISVPSLALIDQLESLVNKSLLHPVEGAEDEPRFGMLETIREYALSQLVESGKEAVVRERHLLYFLRLAEAAWHYLRGRHATEWFNHLAIEHDNLRSALTWATEHNPVAGLRLAVALAEFWDTRGFISEGRQWLERTLERVEVSTNGAPVPTALPLVARLEMGRLAFRQSDYLMAARLASEVEAQARERGEEELLADVISLRGVIAVYQGEVDEAMPLLKEGLELTRHMAYPMVCLDILQSLGAAAALGGEVDQAVTHLEESLKLAQELDATRWIANSLLLLGLAELSRGNVARARFRLVEAITQYRQVFDKVLITYPLILLAQVAVLENQVSRAAKLVGTVDALLEKSGTAPLPVMVATLDAVVNSAYAGLGEHAFSFERREGREMPLDQAIKLAVDGFEA